MALGLGLGIIPKDPDTSFASKTTRSLTGGQAQPPTPSPTPKNSGKEPDTQTPLGISDANWESIHRYPGQGSPRGEVKDGSGGLKYRATQVIQRQGGDPDRKLPIGTSVIGKLLTSIDTREQNSLVKVLLPYGVAFDHDRRIDRNSMLFGTVNYPGNGEKVFIKFHRVLFPDSREFKIEAQALGAMDYSPGLLGDYHDAAGTRMGSVLGLTLVAGMSDVLVEKEVSGQFSPVTTPKSTLKNAFYNGLTKATEQEAQRKAGKLAEEKDFITVEAGLDLIVSLTETFKGEAL